MVGGAHLTPLMERRTAARAPSTAAVSRPYGPASPRSGSRCLIRACCQCPEFTSTTQGANSPLDLCHFRLAPPVKCALLPRRYAARTWRILTSHALNFGAITRVLESALPSRFCPRQRCHLHTPLLVSDELADRSCGGLTVRRRGARFILHAGGARFARHELMR